MDYFYNKSLLIIVLFLNIGIGSAFSDKDAPLTLTPFGSISWTDNILKVADFFREKGITDTSIHLGVHLPQTQQCSKPFQTGEFFFNNTSSNVIIGAIGYLAWCSNQFLSNKFALRTFYDKNGKENKYTRNFAGYYLSGSGLTIAGIPFEISAKFVNLASVGRYYPQNIFEVPKKWPKYFSDLLTEQEIQFLMSNNSDFYFHDEKMQVSNLSFPSILLELRLTAKTIIVKSNFSKLITIIDDKYKNFHLMKDYKNEYTVRKTYSDANGNTLTYQISTYDNSVEIIYSKSESTHEELKKRYELFLGELKSSKLRKSTSHVQLDDEI